MSRTGCPAPVVVLVDPDDVVDIGVVVVVVDSAVPGGLSVVPLLPADDDDEKSRSKVNRRESPGWRITLACSEELIKEQAEGLAHLGGF